MSDKENTLLKELDAEMAAEDSKEDESTGQTPEDTVQNTTSTNDESADDELPSDADLSALTAEVTPKKQITSEERSKDREVVFESTLKKWRTQLNAVETPEEFQEIFESIPDDQPWVKRKLEEEFHLNKVQKEEEKIQSVVSKTLQQEKFQTRFRELAAQIPVKQFGAFKESVKEVREKYPNLDADDLVALAREKSGLSKPSKRAEITLTSRKTSKPQKDVTEVKDPNELNDEEFDEWADKKQKSLSEVRYI